MALVCRPQALAAPLRATEAPTALSEGAKAITEDLEALHGLIHELYTEAAR